MILRGIGSNADNERKAECVNRFNQISLCKKYGWTPQELMNFPDDFYQDLILIENKEKQIEQRELQKWKKDFQAMVMVFLHQIKNKL